MHTSGRAIMRIIERDIRMAGFEYRDKDAKVTYGTISSPLTIKDSGNKCCDEVTVIYDYFDEESKKAERIRIRYWAGLHTSNKGSRHRLYKQKDILGQNKKILAKPKLGTKDVMADYIEDLQIVNVGSDHNLYIPYSGGIDIFDISLDKRIGSIRAGFGGEVVSITFGQDGLAYVAGRFNKIYVMDVSSSRRYNNKGFFYINNALVGELSANSNSTGFNSLSFGPNGLLYALGPNTFDTSKVFIFDVSERKLIDSFVVESASAMIVASNGLLYTNKSRRKSAGGVGRGILIYDPLKKLKVGEFSGAFPKNFAHSDGFLYAVDGDGPGIGVYDLSNPPAWDSTGVICSTPFNHRARVIAISDGLIYNSHASGIEVYNLFDKSKHNYACNKSNRLRNLNTRAIYTMAFNNKKTGQESLVTINLTLRTKNQYGKDRQFKKKDYHAGNYKLDKTDKYKRDTFSSTVLVRNLAL
jgi:hypothetical protein